MFRKPKFIVIAAIVLYAIALGVAWRQLDKSAARRAEAILSSAETGFSDVIDGEIDAMLRTVGGAIINMLDGKCVPRSVSRMRELAETFNIDEVNIVGRDGIVIGSNIPSVMGFDFTTNVLTREFMALTNETTTIVAQPFRKGVANPEIVCRYHGVSFPDHSGFLQLGISDRRLRQNMYTYTPEEADRILKAWHFSIVGWYARADGMAEFAPGRRFVVWDAERGERVLGRYFDYRGLRYVAYLPESYCYSQRNADFVVTALVIGVLLFIFTYVLARLATASDKLEKMHAAADARTAADLALARTIEMSALPSAKGAFLDRLEFSLSAECRPAREVGGDFYDFFAVPDGRVALLIADVAGKGISAAMFMMKAKNEICNAICSDRDLGAAMANANARICGNNEAELFVTVWVGLLDPRSGVIEYVNAGHNRPFVRRASGAVERVDGKGGRFVGMFPECEYRVRQLALGPGDMLFLYTDGFTEAMDGANGLFGERGLETALASSSPSSALESVENAVAGFVGGAEQSDDRSAVVLTWHGVPAARSETFAADGSSLGAAMEWLQRELGLSDRKAKARMLNAADEMMSNIVNYSDSKQFVMSVENSPGKTRLSFVDSGREYNPLSHAEPDTHVPLAERPVGGLGILMTKRLVDAVHYRREHGRNILSLVKLDA